jgi:2-keto-4-pentenoate hydratase/2-oxohepta-3-ene-1,7-dioic acid hydratase in catechol pathway
MRYLMFSSPHDTTPRLGALRGDRVLDVLSLPAQPNGQAPPATLLDLVHRGPAAWRQLKDVLDASTSVGPTLYRTEEIRWHAPIPRPAKNVFCVGRNFLTHIEEGARARGEAVKLPTVPVFFTKAPTSVIGPHDDVPWDRTATQQVDWEAELGAIVGVTGRSIARAAALDHVFGYTIVNDVSARDLQKSHFQFFKGKSLDGFCPLGPLVVTADEFGDPQNKQLVLRVNGIVKQDGNTRDMIFPLDALIASLSHGLTLESGDIIACGTPDGVGFARTPPEFLQDGDVMETEVEGIGMMRNRIVGQG